MFYFSASIKINNNSYRYISGLPGSWPCLELSYYRDLSCHEVCHRHHLGGPEGA